MTRVALLGMTAFLAACNASAAPPTPAKTEVVIANYRFAAGTTVTWINNDDDAHTVMDAAGEFRSGALDQSQSYAFTFVKAGIYRIGCSMHPQMSETIIVQ